MARHWLHARWLVGCDNGVRVDTALQKQQGMNSPVNLTAIQRQQRQAAATADWQAG
jgi:hypothetical protein